MPTTAEIEVIISKLESIKRAVPGWLIPNFKGLIEDDLDFVIKAISRIGGDDRIDHHVDLRVEVATINPPKPIGIGSSSTVTWSAPSTPMRLWSSPTAGARSAKPTRGRK
jgi:hypothetical protein